MFLENMWPSSLAHCHPSLEVCLLVFGVSIDLSDLLEFYADCLVFNSVTVIKICIVYSIISYFSFISSVSRLCMIMEQKITGFTSITFFLEIKVTEQRICQN